MDRCTDCGFGYDLDRAEEAAAVIVRIIAELATILADPSIELRRRRDPKAWSPLEYACHLRDGLTVQRERVLLARRQATPDLVPMGRDERDVHEVQHHLLDVKRQLD